VLPWLIVGASAAFELRRRNDPDVSTAERNKKQLHEREKQLQDERKALDEMFKAKEKYILESEQTLEQQRQELQELNTLKVQFEERLEDLDKYAEELKKENEKLKDENEIWKHRADAYLKQNIELRADAEQLRIENGELKDKVRRCSAWQQLEPATQTPACEGQWCCLCWGVAAAPCCESCQQYSVRWRRALCQTDFPACCRLNMCSAAPPRRYPRCKNSSRTSRTRCKRLLQPLPVVTVLPRSFRIACSQPACRCRASQKSWRGYARTPKQRACLANAYLHCSYL
jgi:actin-related protein